MSNSMKLDRTIIERSPLTKLQKKLLILVDIEGHGVVKAAEILNRGKSTVSIGHARALKRFNEWLSEVDSASGRNGEVDTEALGRALGPTGYSLSDALRGADFEQKLRTLGIPLDKLPSLVALVEKYGDKARVVLEFAHELKRMEEVEGKTYQAVLVDFGEKAQEARELGSEIERMGGQAKALKETLRELHTLAALKEELDKHNLSGPRLQAFIDRNLKLDELGFSSHAAEALGSELQKKGLDPSKAAVILSSMVDEYRTTEEAMADMRRQKGDLQKQVKATLRKVGVAEEELSGIEGLVKVKKGQLEGFKQLEEDQERLHRGTIERREKEVSAQTERLGREITGLEGRKKGLEEEVGQLGDEERQTQEALLDLEGNLEKIEGRVGKTKPFAVIASVTENPKSPLPPSDVARTLLAIVAGFKLYSDANPRDFSPETTRLLGELYGILGKEVRIAGRQAQ